MAQQPVHTSKIVAAGSPIMAPADKAVTSPASSPAVPNTTSGQGAAQPASAKTAASTPATSTSATTPAPVKATTKPVAKAKPKAVKVQPNKKPSTAKKPNPQTSNPIKSSREGASENSANQNFEPFSNSFAAFSMSSDALNSETLKSFSHIMEPFMPNNSTQFDQFSKDAMQAIKDSNDAFTKSSNIMFKGFENYIKVFSNVVQEATDKSTAAMKEISQCKTLNEFTETQNVLAQKALEDLISNSTKLSELSVKICSESFEPINEHFTKAYKKASESLAA